MHIVCSACGTVNRVPHEKLGDGPACGKCHAPLLEASPFALDDDSFGPYIAATELPVVVDFWADWCGPCRAMAPHFANAAAQLPTVRFAKVDSDAAQRTAGRFGIRSIPTLILFKAGAEVARVSGALSANDLLAWLRENGAT